MYKLGKWPSEWVTGVLILHTYNLIGVIIYKPNFTGLSESSRFSSVNYINYLCGVEGINSGHPYQHEEIHHHVFLSLALVTGKWARNEDAFPIRHGDIPASYVSFRTG